MISFATSRVALKEQIFPDGRLVRAGGLAVSAPVGAMLDDPIRQRLLKADVSTGFFRLNPFVPQNFFTLGLKLAVQGRVLQQIIRGR
jgi:hypothetical protein